MPDEESSFPIAHERQERFYHAPVQGRGPFVYTVENGGLLFEGTSSMSDPAGRNNYSLFGAVDTITQRPSYGINYVNSSLPH